MPTTARDIIVGALSEIGVYSRGLGLSAEDSADGLASLNDMLSAWSAEGISIPQVTERSGVSLQTGKTEYTVSLTGDIAIQTPVGIDSLVVISGTERYNATEFSDFDHYLRSEQWSGNVTPGWYLYEYGKLFIGGSPDQPYDIELWVYDNLAPFTGLSEESSFPDYFIPAMKYNLATLMAASFGKEPKVSTAKYAYDFKFALETRSFKSESSTSDFAPNHIRSGIARI